MKSSPSEIIGLLNDLNDLQEETDEILLRTLEDIQRLRHHRFLAPQSLIQGVKNCRNLADVIRLHDRLVDLQSAGTGSGMGQ